jgi:ATP-dependent DNA helicase RecG
MILAVDEITRLIRNTSYTYTIEGSMFPETMNRYDVFTLREPLNNAIAHQDYNKMARIEVIEDEDEKLSFRNHGQFIPASIEEVITNDFPESMYRNPFLVEAMRNVNMVETEGGGIRKLFVQQKKRFFPMPTYTLTDDMVKCEISGKVLDENFAKILINNPDLSLPEIILLDKVQKREPLSDDAIKLLRAKKFIEGRKSNLFLSFKVVNESKHIGLKASYIKNKSFDDDYFKGMILNYITTFKKATRRDIEELLKDKLPDILSERQKYDKTTNLLAALRKDGKIKVEGRNWILA